MQPIEFNRTAFSRVVSDRVRLLSETFGRHGEEIRLVGGVVRDLLAGRPSKDIDFATTASPDAMMAICQTEGLRWIETGLSHGTLTILVDHEPFEVTTLRVDFNHTGRHADVAWTRDFRADAARRDFTINAMSMTTDGDLFDYFGGLDHLRAGKVIFVGSPVDRIREDYLRILRYFRFVGRFEHAGFDVETDAAIRHNAHGLRAISGERIWQEMKQILASPRVGDLLVAMGSTSVAEMIGLSVDRVETVIEARCHTADPLSLLSLLVRSDQIESMNDRLKWSREELRRLTSLVNLDRHDFDLASGRAAAVRGVDRFDIAEILRRRGQIDAADQLVDWRATMPLSGKDLLAKGHQPGPQIGRLLARAREIWIAGDYRAGQDDLIRALEVDADLTR